MKKLGEGGTNSFFSSLLPVKDVAQEKRKNKSEQLDMLIVPISNEGLLDTQRIGKNVFVTLKANPNDAMLNLMGEENPLNKVNEVLGTGP